MANYAIIIGIDEYEEPKWNLRGAVEDARMFYDWVTTAGKVDPHNVRMLLGTSDPEAKALATGDATQDSIVRTIIDYQDGAGKDGDRLYFYYAGHGLSAPGVQKGGRVEPVLVPSDVKSLKYNSNRLISFSEIMPCFAGQAPWEQFFFIDACRDFGLEEFQAGIGGVGPWFPPPKTDHARRASQYLLYAASPGQKAAETSVGIFTSVLLDALTGKEGMEMTFSQATATYQIHFPKLVKYVRKRVEEKVSRKIAQNAAQYVQVPQYQTLAEGADPVLTSLPIDAVKKYPLRVRVSPSGALQSCRVAAGIYLPGLPQLAEYEHAGPPATLPVKFELLPQDYSVSAVAEGYKPAKATCDLYQPREVDLLLEPDVLEMADAALAYSPLRGPAPTTGRVLVRSEDSMAEVVIRDAEGKERARAMHEVHATLEAGMYRAQLLVGGTVRGEELVQVDPGEIVERVLAAPALEFGTAQTKLLRDLGLLRGDSQYVYTGRDHALADGKLASLLAFAAYAKIRNAEELQYLQPIGIDIPQRAPAIVSIIGVSGDHPLRDMTPQTFLGATSLIVFDAQQRVASRGEYRPVRGFPAAVQQAIEIDPGGAAVRLTLPGRAPTHYALACLEERITLFIVVVNDDGTVETQQYLIPAPGAQHDYQTNLSSHNLRRVEMAQRAYRKTADIPPEQLNELLFGKWIDPLLGCLAGYSLLRRGERQEFEGAAENMLRFFPGLPDSHVLAALQWPHRQDFHFRNAEERGLPVFAEGFRALQKWRESQQRALAPEVQDVAQGLLPASPWTAWVLNRPALPMRADGTILPPAGGGWEAIENAYPRIAEIVRSVGMIFAEGGMPSGTGFLIAPGIVLAPRFVVERIDPSKLRVTFEPRPDEDTRGLVVETVTYPPDTPQFALLHIPDKALPPLTIASQLPPPHAPVYVVSYPMLDKYDTWNLHRYDGTKRISPGRLLGEVDANGMIHHDCATANGSAGGAIVDVATHRVVAVHMTGQLTDKLKIGGGMAITSRG